jgi:hypothetical protein
MLSGAIAPPDAPPGYAPIAALLTHLADAPPPEPIREAAAAHVISDMIRDAAQPVRHGGHRLAVTLALTATLAISFSGLAYAQALPQPVQHATNTLLRALGISHHTANRPRHSAPPSASPRRTPTLPTNRTTHPPAARPAQTHPRTSSTNPTTKPPESTRQPSPPPATNPPGSPPAPAAPATGARPDSPGRHTNRSTHAPTVTPPTADHRPHPANPMPGPTNLRPAVAPNVDHH